MGEFLDSSTSHLKGSKERVRCRSLRGHTLKPWGRGCRSCRETGSSVGASKVGQVEAGEGSCKGKLCVGTTSELHFPLNRGREFVPPVSAPVSLSFSWEALAFLVKGLSG